MSPAPDGMTDSSQDEEDGTDDEQDDSDHPQNRDLEQKPDYQQDDAQSDHVVYRLSEKMMPPPYQVAWRVIC